MNRKGFTLIELVMVIVIIGILAAVAIPRFMSLQDEAKVARCQADVGAIRTGISGWYATFHAKGGNTTTSYPCNLSVGACSANGFPSATNLNTEAGSFASIAFTDGKMPGDSHIINGGGWGDAGYYNETTGVLNQTALCGS